MKVAVEYLRSIFISVEFAVLILCFYVAWAHPPVVAKMNSLIAKGADPIKWLSAVPAAVLVWSMGTVRKLRFPEKDRKSLLQNWPEYWKLCVVVNVALGFALLFTAAGLFPWLLSTTIGDDYRSLFLFGSLSGALIVGASCYLAEMAINDEFARKG